MALLIRAFHMFHMCGPGNRKIEKWEFDFKMSPPPQPAGEKSRLGRPVGTDPPKIFENIKWLNVSNLINKLKIHVTRGGDTGGPSGDAAAMDVLGYPIRGTPEAQGGL